MKRPPDTEVQVQDAYQALLDGADVPYRREQVVIPYSTKTFRPDFTVDSIGVAIEVKLVKQPGDDKRVIDEMNADIPAYRSKYPNVIFVVYDVGGSIRDIEGFKSSFEETEKRRGRGSEALRFRGYGTSSRSMKGDSAKSRGDAANGILETLRLGSSPRDTAGVSR